MQYSLKKFYYNFSFKLNFYFEANDHLNVNLHLNRMFKIAFILNKLIAQSNLIFKFQYLKEYMINL